MTKGFNPKLTVKECTLRRAHGPHSWAARGVNKYYQCMGHHGKTPIQPRTKGTKS